MEKEFFCSACGITFTSEGKKKEYVHPVYGPCSGFTAECPDCGNDCSEKVRPSKSKSSKGQEMPVCGNTSCCTGCGYNN